jgi:nucleotide sugar dehydrogenase
MKVAVVGLGKIGLPLAARYALSGVATTGCDVSQARVDEVNAGVNPIRGEAGLDEAVRECVANGSLRATTDTPIAVKESDVVVVVVPVIALHDGTLDWRFMDAANDAIAGGLHPGILIVWETTLPVGTTRRFASSLAQRSGLNLGTDFFAAFSPERVYSGRILQDLQAYPKIVGGVDAASGARARAFYETVLPGVAIEAVDNAETAELVKLAETTYRDVNIAYANELARYAAARGIDVDPVIRLSNTQPFSHIHAPGAGVGGHCIPHYPRFILADGADAPLIRTAREINDAQPGRIADQLEAELGTLQGKKILVLGVSYRENVKEVTSSPGVDLIKLLPARGAHVAANDPHFTLDEIQAVGANPVSFDRVGEFDGVILQAAHDEYAAIDWSKLRPGTVVVDGRNKLDPNVITAAGAVYVGVGRRTRRPE